MGKVIRVRRMKDGSLNKREKAILQAKSKYNRIIDSRISKLFNNTNWICNIPKIEKRIC